MMTSKPSYRWQTRTTWKHAKNCSNSTCLQRCRWQYWSVFIRLAVGPSEICEIPRNSLKIQIMQFKVIDVGANRKRICTFPLATNSGRITGGPGPPEEAPW